MGAAEWHRPAEGSQPPAAGAAHGYLQTRPPPPCPRKQAGRWSPGFTQPDSALSSECAEGVTPADSNKQVGSRGERKARQNGELSSSQKSIPERHAPLSLRRAGSLGSRRRTKKHDLGIFPRPLFFFFLSVFPGTFGDLPWPQFPSLQDGDHLHRPREKEWGCPAGAFGEQGRIWPLSPGGLSWRQSGQMLRSPPWNYHVTQVVCPERLGL